MTKRPNGEELMMSVEFNKKLAQKAQENIDNMYKNTYYTDNKDRQYIDTLRNKMDQSINGLIDKTKMRNGNTNISALYARTLAKGDNSLSIMKDITDSSMLSDIMDLYSSNMVVRDMDREIDVIIKYLPRLKRALDIIKQAVLAADHMDKENTKISVINTIDRNITDGENEDTNSEDKIQACQKKYDFHKLQNDIYDDTSKYGERFTYVVPYKRALERVLQRSAKASGNLTESSYLTEDTILEAVNSSTNTFNILFTESENPEVYVESDMDASARSIFLTEEHESIQVEINTSGVIPSIVIQENNMRRIFAETASLIQEASPKSDYGLVRNSNFLKNIDKELKKFAKDSIKGPNELASDGLIKSKKEGPELNVPGCIVEKLKHEFTKPIRIGNVCLGYYYIECENPMDFEQTTFSSTLGGLRPKRSVRDRANMDKSTIDNAVLQKIAKQISQKIDKKFINANQDLAEEIYTILKYNADHGDGKVARVRISFLPPEDVVHSYFRLNERTHRGISDLEESLFPAKLYSCLYISNVIALLTRGYDKRVYHVKQTVDTNITAVLLNVINQIKQSNFNLRQIENMNNILNVTGRFNDLVIPQNANGESPVNMEVLPAQNIEPKTEFMNQLEEMAIEQTGVSMEMITNHFNSEQTATNVVQNSERMLIMVYERQILYNQILSELYTKIYQAEYDTTDIINVELPMPSMLKLSNVSQLLSVGNDIIQNITNMLSPTDDDQTKLTFVGKLMEYYFGSFLPMPKLKQLYDDAKVEVAVKQDKPVPEPGMDGGMPPQDMNPQQ